MFHVWPSLRALRPAKWSHLILPDPEYHGRRAPAGGCLVATEAFVRGLDPSLYSYFAASLALTILNKYLLRGFFSFPWILTCIQLLFGTLGSFTASVIGVYEPVSMTRNDTYVIRLVSFLFSAELLAVNLSLRVVPVPLHLTARAFAPLLTHFLESLCFHKAYTRQMLSCALVIAVGIVMTAQGLQTPYGGLLTAASVLLTAVRSIVTSQLLQDRMHLTPLNIQLLINPLCIIYCSIFAIFNGEWMRFLLFSLSSDFTKRNWLFISADGILAFVLTASTLAAERRVRKPGVPLTSQLAQALTIVVSVFVFELSLGPTNIAGVVLTFLGGSAYCLNDALLGRDELMSPAGASAPLLPLTSPAVIRSAAGAATGTATAAPVPLDASAAVASISTKAPGGTKTKEQED